MKIPPFIVPFVACLAAFGLLAACPADTAAPATATGDEDDSTAAPITGLIEAEVEPPEPRLRRLTSTQLASSLRDLLGAGAPIPPPVEPDVSEGGLFSVGAGVTTISSLGVEKLEDAAYSLAAWALTDPARRAALVPCEPAGTVDAGCAETFVHSFGRRAWRRPLADDEAAELVAVAGEAAETLGDFYVGLEYATAAMLQAPPFIYRVELGEDDPDNPGDRRFTGWEMATRLSFLLWNTTPDDALLDAAESGELVTDDGVEEQVDRLLASDRARDGVRTFFTEWLKLHELAELYKDPSTFLFFHPELGEDALDETLQVVEHIVFTEDADVRDLLTTQTTFVNQRLASLYGVPLPAADDAFHQVQLPNAGGRRGLLGQAAILALYSHPTSSSATKRGQFVRQTLLCGEIPPPPADVDTSLPEPDASSPTLRERVAVHLTDPACANCHLLMDPIGLGLENFDGVGRWRDTENDAIIDASGDLDGEPFADGWDLGATVRNHPDLASCLVRRLWRYAWGRTEIEGDDPALVALDDRFAADGHRFVGLLRAMATSRAFRQTGEVVQ